MLFYITNAVRLKTVYPNKQLVYFRSILAYFLFMTNSRRQTTKRGEPGIFLEKVFTVISWYLYFNHMILFRLTGNRQVQASGPTVTAATFQAIYYISAPLLRRSISCIISRKNLRKNLSSSTTKKKFAKQWNTTVIWDISISKIIFSTVEWQSREMSKQTLKSPNSSFICTSGIPHYPHTWICKMQRQILHFSVCPVGRDQVCPV